MTVYYVFVGQLLNGKWSADIMQDDDKVFTGSECQNKLDALEEVSCWFSNQANPRTSRL